MTSSKHTGWLITFTVITGALLATGSPARAQDESAPASAAPPVQTATLPLISCWYKGQVLFYIRIDTSDQPTAEQQGLNYVPQLVNVLTSSPSAYDDIYTFSNFNQFNVVPSAPYPVGPKNTDTTYQPLWQVSQVAWNPGAKPHTLTSEEEILAASQSGEVTLTKTNVVINCPIVFRPGAGRLPNLTVQFGSIH